MAGKWQSSCLCCLLLPLASGIWWHEAYWWWLCNCQASILSLWPAQTFWIISPAPLHIPKPYPTALLSSTLRHRSPLPVDTHSLPRRGIPPASCAHQVVNGNPASPFTQASLWRQSAGPRRGLNLGLMPAIWGPPFGWSPLLAFIYLAQSFIVSKNALSLIRHLQPSLISLCESSFDKARKNSLGVVQGQLKGE